MDSAVDSELAVAGAGTAAGELVAPGFESPLAGNGCNFFDQLNPLSLPNRFVLAWPRVWAAVATVLPFPSTKGI